MTGDASIVPICPAGAGQDVVAQAIQPGQQVMGNGSVAKHVRVELFVTRQAESL
jgi:hypothetical protein